MTNRFRRQPDHIPSNFARLFRVSRAPARRKVGLWPDVVDHGI
jgi:hypothetical protein